MIWKKLTLLPLFFIFTVFIVPHYILPLLSNAVGLNAFKGLQGVRIQLWIVVIPIPIFETPDSYSFVGFLMAGSTAIAYLLYRDGIRMRSMLRKQSASLVPLISSYIRTGMPVLDALNEAGKTLGDPIYSYIARFVNLVKLGSDPEESFENCFSGFPRDVRIPLATVVVAIGSGGRIADILSVAERFTLHMSRLEELRRSRLEGYRAVLILAIIAFTVSAILSLTIVSYASKALYFSGLIGRVFSLQLVSTMYYIPALMIVITSSIAISRVVYGETAIALKYISILSPIVSIAFAVATHLL
ncbi:MAG: type II secretion system F family protein [Ignisphaera sp.]